MPISRRKFVFSAAAGAGAAALAPSFFADSQKPAPQGLDDWSAVRRLFHLDPKLTHAALFFIASHPAPVREAIEAYRRAIDTDPVTTLEEGLFGTEAKNIPLRACSAIARFIGGDAADIALTSNTTTGLALLYLGLQLKPGDEILTTEHDHEVHHVSIDYACARSGATSRRIALFPPHQAQDVTKEGLVRTLREAIRPATRVLGITWVHSSSGVRLPLKEIAAAVAEVNASRPAAERVLLFIDGVHGMGSVQRDIVNSGIDAFSAGLHKWMLGPRGTGFVWAKPEVWARLRPTIPTFSSWELYLAWTENRPPKGPARADWFSPGGFQSYEHQWAIPAAFELHETIGHEKIVKRIEQLNGLAKKELATMPHVRLHTPIAPELSAGINCFEVEGVAPAEVVQRLRTAGVIASTSPYAVTYPRLSFGIANDERDVARSIDAVRKMKA